MTTVPCVITCWLCGMKGPFMPQSPSVQAQGPFMPQSQQVMTQGTVVMAPPQQLAYPGMPGQPPQQVMVMQPQPGMQWVQQPVAPQMTPWQRVLAHLEKQGIPFQSIASCHFDTRRDILKEVFGPKESLMRGA